VEALMSSSHDLPAGIRPATRHDEPAVVAVDAIASAGDRERMRLLREAVTAGECILYESDGRVLGFAIVRRAHFYGRDFIDLLFVASDARRRGIGRSLIRASTSAATTSRVFTSTNKSNIPMQALLQSEGWSPSGELVGLDEGDPELVYYRSR
jgi:ribosomal protein S18 acetylase RimI-like enzyme